MYNVLEETVASADNREWLFWVSPSLPTLLTNMQLI